jgi:hypothetical protein
LREQGALTAAGAFVVVEPETSGRPVRAASGGRDAFAFDVWLGDDLVRAYPAVLVTSGLRGALQALPRPTGFHLSRARVRSSRFYRLHNPDRRLPAFWVVEIQGRPGLDDVGLTEAGALVVSRRIMDVLLASRVSQAVFAQYTPGRPARRPARA